MFKRKKKSSDSHKFYKGHERFVPENFIMGVVVVFLLALFNWLFG